MLNICSVIRKFFGFIKAIPKKVYRTGVVICAGLVIVALICFHSKDFNGSGKNKNSGYNVNKESEFEFSDDETDDLAEVQERFNCLQQTYMEDIYQYSCKEIQSVLSAIRNISNYDNRSKSQPSVMANEELNCGEEESAMETSAVQTSEQQVESEPTPTSSVSQTEEVTSQIIEIEEETTTESVEVYVNNTCDIELTDTDYHWLKQIVEAEAGNQDEVGKIMVANVIINRVQSNQFPNTIKSVIFQKKGNVYQFEPVKNNRIYNVNPTQNTISCVDRALAGEDYSQGAYYFTTKTSSKSWFNKSLRLLFVHGNHYFYTFKN